MSNDISLTYEKLFDITRREKTTEELQRLDETFFEDVVEYLQGKTAILTKDVQHSLFSKSEKEITKKQLDNIKKLITELYSKREQKIVNLAIMKSRTSSNLIDTAALLPEEKIFFNNLVQILNDNKRTILFSLLEGKIPDTKNNNQESTKKQENNSLQESTAKIEFLNDVPKFVGKELEHYGPFSKNQVVELPFDVANILVSKGRAKKIE